ncbi:MAG: FG-GAP-like repeat-containing protein [Thermodesulfobacteriota bacterium]
MKLKLILIIWLIFSLNFLPHLFAQPKEVSKVYKVAILPFIIHSQENLDYMREGIYDILSSRISVEGRIIVIERSTVERILWEIRPMRLDEAIAKEVGSRAGADYIVLGSLTKIGSYISLDARLLSITEEKPPLGVYTQHKGLDDVMTKIGDFAENIGYKILGRRFIASQPSERRSPYIIRPERWRIDREGLEFKKSQTFEFEIKGLDIGDVDGDGKNEIVVMDYHNLYIFKYDGEKLNLFRKIEAGYQNNFLTLDVSDINRNGFSEIIVTSVIEDNLQSFILEYEQGEFRSITRKAGWFFKTLEHPREGPILIGQKMSSEGLLSGPIYQFLWKKKAFEKGPKMPLPKDFKIFGFAIGDIQGQGKPDIIQIDEFDYLKILSHDGKFIWKSKENFGGTINFYETLKKKEKVYRGDAPPWRVYISGRILIKDLDGDGVNEIIINRNHLSGIKLFQKLKSFERGEIYNLIWDETGLTTNWKTRELNGYISDYQVKDASNSGENELVVALVETPRSGMMEKGRSKILFFKLF